MIKKFRAWLKWRGVDLKDLLILGVGVAFLLSIVVFSFISIISQIFS